MLARVSFLIFLALVAPRAGAEAAIASAHPLASEAGYKILARGGNAFDAAVAVSAALAVVEPFGSGLGGGGFWLLHQARNKHDVLIDGREVAPAAARRNMYLDTRAKPLPRASLDGPLAAAIPGTPAALVLIAAKYGRLPLAMSLQPAIELAQNGFVVDARFQRMAEGRAAALQQFASASRYLRDGRPIVAGTILRQPELAATLQEIAVRGAAGFYKGRVASELIESVRAAGGIWSYADLANYRAIERAPAIFRYKDLSVTTAPLPSSAGVVLAQILQMLEPFPLDTYAPAKRVHVTVEAMRRAYHDRARYLGDPDFVEVPLEKLTSRQYAIERARSIDLEHASGSGEVPRLTREGANTTHFSIIDRSGNRVAATMSINTPFGSGFVAGTSGVLLNNEMDDFVIAPGEPNAYGLVGGTANTIQPGKRPLSSMAPTFVEDARGILVLGTPGGSRILSMLALAILDYHLKREVAIDALLGAPRYHHQYLPDVIEVEPEGFDFSVASELELIGHTLKPAATSWGNMQAVFYDKARRRSQAFSDPRASRAQSGF